jgi:LysM repeat protein
MKRIWLWAAVAVLCTALPGRSQDLATEQRIKELSGKIEDLYGTIESMRRSIDSLQREVRHLQEQQNTPKVDYAAQDDLKRLETFAREVDRKRLEDYEKIRTQLEKLGKALNQSLNTPPPKRAETPPEKPAKPEPGYDYVVQKGDTLSLIVKMCRERNLKVTQDQILKANPHIKPERLVVGQKIFIPTPQ